MAKRFPVKYFPQNVYARPIQCRKIYIMHITTVNSKW